MTNSNDNRKKGLGGGGRKFITFLCFVAVAVFAVGAFALTKWIINPPDRLAIAAPDTAALYVHGEAASFPSMEALPNEARMEIGGIPGGVRPHDMAVFAVPEDGSLLWGAALGWRIYPGPTEEEDRLLRAAGWRPFIRNIYVIGSAARLDPYDRRPLLKDPLVSRALANVAGLMTTQGYIAPAGLTSIPFIKDLEPVAFGIDTGTEPAYGILLPAAEAAEASPLLGLGIRPSVTRTTTARTSSGADLTVTSPTSIVDAVNVLFWPVEEARLKRQAPPSEEYLAAVGHMRQMLNGPVSISILMDKDTGKANYVAGFPTSSPVTLQSSILAYLAASLPDKKTVALPDDDTTVELQLNPEKYSFVPLGDADLAGAEIVSDNEYDFSLIIAPDGEGGSLLSTKADFIKEVLSDPAGSDAGRCSERGYPSVLHLRMPFLGYQHVSMISSGDKLIRVCGYHLTGVDN